MSMKDAGILDGDLVGRAPHRGGAQRQIIVARLESEVTVKRYRQQGSVVWLMPENPEFEPIRVDLQREALLIEGVWSGCCGATPEGIPQSSAGPVLAGRRAVSAPSPMS